MNISRTAIVTALFGLLAVTGAWAACEEPPTTPGGEGSSNVGTSYDPNEMKGPLGFGNPDTQRFVRAGEWLTYTVYFENLSNATVAAQEVYVDAQLSPHLDGVTLELGEVVFNNQTELGLVGKQNSEMTVQQNNAPLQVKVTFTLDQTTGKMRWYLRSYDPTRRQYDYWPEAVDSGFLPPNDESGCGEGHLCYRIKVKDDVPAGTRIPASAEIVFDHNAMIPTDPSWWNNVAVVVAVNFDSQGGGAVTNRALVAGLSYGDLPSSARTGYAFGGWWTGVGGAGVQVTTSTVVTATASQTLYAKWTVIPYTVTFNAQGGTAPNPATKGVTFGAAYGALATTARTGYTFAGWWTNAAYTGTALAETTTVTTASNHMLYAKWTVNTYTVTFDAQSGSAPNPASKGVTFGAAYGALATSARTGYAFGGWWTAAGGAGTQVTETSLVTASADHTLYAKWTANTYTVTYNGNGATGGSTPNSGHTYDVARTLSVSSYVRTGYTFAGWAMSAVGPVMYGDRKSVVNLTSAQGVTVALYAKWEWSGPLGDPAEDAALTDVGAYDGFFFNETAFGTGRVSTVRGTLSLTLTTLAGKLTAKATVQKGSLTFTAVAWTSSSAGTYRALMTTRTGEVLVLYVRQNHVWGTLAVAGETLTLDGARNRFANSKDAAAQAVLGGFKGYYTVALPIEDAFSAGWVGAAPQGAGYLTLTVGAGGSAKVAGMLAEGTAVSQASRLMAFFDGSGWACVPVFVPLYAKTGWIGALLWIEQSSGRVVADADVGWRARWEKPGKGPDGFSELLDPQGCYYNTVPWLAWQYRFYAEPGRIGYYLNGVFLDLLWDPVYNGVGVTASGTRMTMAKGTPPVKRSDGEGGYWYDYDSANSALATLTFTAKTGIFKGGFKGYCDYTDAYDRLQHKTVSVTYAGIMVPESKGATLMSGEGHCLVPDNDPAVKVYKVKRSFPVWLNAEE